MEVLEDTGGWRDGVGDEEDGWRSGAVRLPEARTASFSDPISHTC